MGAVIWISYCKPLQHSMHWVTPKTAGRMLQAGDNLLVQDEAVSLKTSPVTEKDVEAGYVAPTEAEEYEVSYEPTPYNEVSLKVNFCPQPILRLDF